MSDSSCYVLCSKTKLHSQPEEPFLIRAEIGLIFHYLVRLLRFAARMVLFRDGNFIVSPGVHLFHSMECSRSVCVLRVPGDKNNLKV